MEPVNPTILIIGGGLGGLCLAQGLLKAGHALREICCSVELGETDINAPDGSILASRAGGSFAMKGLKLYTCDRTVLRDILIHGLSDYIHYSKELVRYEIVNGGVTAHFHDGSIASGSFLVGADGSGSVTRKQFLPDHLPLNTEGLSIYGKTPITKELLERFPTSAMRWMTLVLDRTPMTQTLDIDDTVVTLLLEPIRFPKKGDRFDQYTPPDYIYWVLIARKHIFGLKANVELSKYTVDEVAEISLRITDCWDPSLRSILHLQDKTQSSFLRILSADPNMKAWQSTDKITIIEDACHVMSPCGGVGAVTSLVDGANLAKTIVNKGISIENISEFEQAMRESAKLSILRSYTGGRKMFGQKPFD
ncbi:cercosporin toxin biosynthesis protein [Xylariaceae sp. FL0255]|nr:cercosporin toxin biosynthesis protein [Xylariaceae sp. FL0255]